MRKVVLIGASMEQFIEAEAEQLEEKKVPQEETHFSPEVQNVIRTMELMKKGQHISYPKRRKMKASLEAEKLKEEDVLPYVN